jgi:tRNA G10  N-methylase Trm11
VRAILEPWGFGETPSIVCERILQDFDKTAGRKFTPTRIESKNSWKVEFRRLGRMGRSGLDETGKKEFLETFDPVLSRLHGSVNLTHPDHTLLYLEDWLGFHGRHSSKRVGAPQFAPLAAFFGRIVARGPEIQSLFDLSNRPFIGTTAMAPLPAHLCAAAGRVRPGDTVLDPFCGTGSMLLAACALGAKVVGSDIDAGCLGINSPEGEQNDTPKTSKNVNFKRFSRPNGGASSKICQERTINGNRTWDQQFGLCTSDNFVFYNFGNSLLGLRHLDILDWLQPNGDHNLPDVFDSIVTDPPYNKREIAKVQLSSSLSSDEDPKVDPADEAVSALLAVAARRLKPGGRLAMWYPSAAHVDKSEVTARLEACQARGAALLTSSFATTQMPSPRSLSSAGDGESVGPQAALPLALERLGEERLHDKLWRWLVVYRKINYSE